MPEYDRLNRAIASSPIPGPRNTPRSRSSPDPSVRQMRLKILYTFDENKTNCLARWPHPLDIRTAHLNQDTIVGVIELKTCLQAIATASPEIVAGLGQDYTVYAYDYSEYETPLVGQGMLSWILASASPTPGAPASQSRTMVTGRVSKSGMGLFSDNAQEMLEVKLRLVPVPTSRQNEYLESMKKYRDISQITPHSFDPQAWTSFLQQNPLFIQQIQQTMQSRSQSPTISSGQGNLYGIEQVQRLLSGDRAPQSLGRQPLSRANSFANAEVGQQLPRLPSPASSVASTAAAAPKRRGRKPGPNYRGPKLRRGKKQVPPESTDPGYGTGDERLEEGPSRKRAKVVQADWDGKQDLGKQGESLRVAASTAASVRIYQPKAVRPGSNSSLALDSQPRAPTPTADISQNIRNPRLPVSKSNLGRHTLLVEQSAEPSYESNAASDKAPGSSPEKSAAGSSPLDLASSPPIFLPNSTTHSSPRLPEFTRPFEDSGFISGDFDDLFEDSELRPIDNEDYKVAEQYSKRLDLPALPLENSFEQDKSFSEDLSQMPQKQVSDCQKKHDQVSLAGDRPIIHVASPISIPSVPASDPIWPPTMSRSQTWSGNDAAHAASDIVISYDTSNATERPKSSGRARRRSDTGGQSGVKRKAVIKSKLASSIAAGEVPPFCDNCGAIETPTWRKAWSKIHSGTPEHVRLSEDEGGILAWQTLQTDNKGMICLYRIIKKTLARDDQGFSEMLLCNPCGIHLISRKCMRPKEMWNKGQKGPDDKSERRPSDQGQKFVSNSFSRGQSRTSLCSEPLSPTKAGGQSEAAENEPQLPALRKEKPDGKTGLSTRTSPLDEASAAAALERAIQSSPHKFGGTKEVPIEVEDLTPQPTRRILFPSPTQSEQAKSKRNLVSSSTLRLSQPKSTQNSLATTPNSAEKENRPPSNNDDISCFLNEDSYASPSPSKRRTYIETLKRSPVRHPPSADDPHASAKFLRQPPVTPKRTPARHARPLAESTPFTAHLNQLLSDANSSTPVANHFDFPTLPSLRNTPNSSRSLGFDFGNFDSQDLVSTDVPMPSSPPWDYGSFGDSVEDGHDSLWGDYALPNMIASPEGSEKIRLERDAALKLDNPENEGNVASVETVA